MRTPDVSVGIIMGRTELRFTLSGIYAAAGMDVVTGAQTVRLSDGGMGVVWNGSVYPELCFTPSSYDGDSFELEGVTIGVNFHWERKENQRFRGSLRIIMENGTLTAVNILGVEDYLVSVISSEMRSTSSPELLRAHAVISRSWLLAQMENSNRGVRRSVITASGRGDEIVRWWDHDDHLNYDVCADDHCQRYQGIDRVESSAAAAAVTDTRGQVLTHGGQLCDARFSKCCGGVMEIFSTCWDDTDKPYLAARRDSAASRDFPNLTIEAEAEKWINGNPDAYCRCSDPRILRQVLNGYDREDTDFYRWEVEYTGEQLRGLVEKRLERSIGDIMALRPLRRGPSGRIYSLLIEGSEGSVTIGKELMVRRVLSDTHLKSSAFTVTASDIDSRGIPGRFRLRGAGWGHGVGLCQIGAAVMGELGMDYRTILAHYYPGAEITTLY